ncbi:DNA/RNA non-specific endonuclease [Ferruginibacter yonginensis]|uniref:Endonuclease n=1 Tax=Ferruginibacter yonginensis TaxID=1310416 RepID=A0ABV8QS32_9BACT
MQAQPIEIKIKEAVEQLNKIEQERKKANTQLENLKLEKICNDLVAIGLPAVAPNEQLVKHSAYYLDYAPTFKQARWVAHIITPDVINGVVFRTNDFRVDSLVKGGSAEEADYFTKTLKPDGSFLYDGYGYDRGHLAPSADFRWSQKALSESYYYSNMSPQLPDFNRGGWGDLEDAIRGYLYKNATTQLYVVTGPVLKEGLPVITKSKNKVAIPQLYFKVVLDAGQQKAIGFVMPNATITQPLQYYAVSIDSVEALTGLDFFNKLPLAQQAIFEANSNATDWLPTSNSADVAPLPQEQMAKNHFNTTVAQQYTKSNNEIYVCGTVVGARLSKAGNILINLDKQFPNQVFTIFIKKDNIPNFSYNPTDVLKGKIICAKGKVIDLGGTATMYIDSERALSVQ